MAQTGTNVKVSVSTPFRSLGKPSRFPLSAFGVGDAAKERYVRALVAEIEAFDDGDAAGMAVDEVEFAHGPASGLSTAQLMRVVRALHKKFALVDGARIHASEVPGGLTADFAGFCKSVGMEYVEVEMLTVDVPALRAAGLPPSRDDTVACFQVVYFTGKPDLGILLDAGMEPSCQAFRKSVMEALGRSPLFVRAVGMSGEQADSLAELCGRRGMVPVGEGVFGRPGFAGVPLRHENQVGFGLNALTQLDGIRFQNTSDLALYCAHSTEFPLIARQVG